MLDLVRFSWKFVRKETRNLPDLVKGGK